MSSVLFPRKNARHAKPSTTPKVLLAGGMTAAFAVTDAALVAGSASAGGSVAQFERLAQCESGGNWSINTGNGYYGGLQFNLGTWRSVGMSGYPHQASKATQIAAGQKLHSQRGWSPWPACSRKLGLAGDGGSTATSSTTQSTRSSAERRVAAQRASRTRATAVAQAQAQAQARAARIAAIRALEVTAPPRFDGHVLTVEDRSTYRIAVKHWQRRMAARGWTITVDGHFGPQTARVAAAFAREKQVSTPHGTVDQQLWDLAWTSAVVLAGSDGHQQPVAKSARFDRPRAVAGGRTLP
ncbi:MAG: transglycosylase family protein [Actinobacteria bacterium]|nr:transglycosylase family protein [Actinomycetota bacterium]